MQSDSNLRETLRSIDHKSYPAYKSLRGSYRFADYVLSIDHVQGDPFAAPSHVRVTVDAKAAAFPEYAMKNTRTRTALADELLRTFAAQINHFTFKAKGSGKSGLISVTHCGQEILTRTACEVNEKEITVRFAVGFPANGRTINARELEKILFTYLPECVKHSFYYKNLDARRIRDAVELAEDQQAVRDQLGTDFCRRCNYCAPCSVGIQIPSVFLFAGYLQRYDLEQWARDRYSTLKVKASACIGWGKSEPRRPYHNVSCKVRPPLSIPPADPGKTEDLCS